MSDLVVHMTVDELRALVTEAVSAAIAKLQPEQPSADLITRAEVAKILHVNPHTVPKLIKRGLPAYPFGVTKKRWRFRRHEVLAWLQREVQDGKWDQDRAAVLETRASVRRVYFIHANGTGHIKIGASSDVRGRLSQLQTSCGDTLSLLLDVPGAEIQERALHKRFAHLRLKGEWFRSEPELLSYIDGLRVGVIAMGGHANG